MATVTGKTHYFGAEHPPPRHDCRIADVGTAAQPARRAMISPSRPTDALDRRPIVLLVEDDEAVRQVAVLILDLLGYAVVEFAEAEAARDYLAGGAEVSVLFTDVRLPGAMNGTDLALESRLLRPDLPILLTTGNVGDIAPHFLRRLPGTEVLLKPYGRARLERMLAAAIARRPAR